MDLNVKNDKPVVFLKVQTTGADVDKDRIVELALIKYEEGKSPISIVRRFEGDIYLFSFSNTGFIVYVLHKKKNRRYDR